jgi:hypothetical protein
LRSAAVCCAIRTDAIAQPHPAIRALRIALNFNSSPSIQRAPRSISKYPSGREGLNGKAARAADPRHADRSHRAQPFGGVPQARLLQTVLLLE